MSRDDAGRLFFQGSGGRATRINHDTSLPGSEATVAWYLLEGSWHPLWSQFIMSCIKLDDVPGWPEPKLQFPGATHELVVAALDPGNPPTRYDIRDLEARGVEATNGWLEPVDVCHQFTATDAEMEFLTDCAAEAVARAMLNPSTDDSRTAMREGWLQSLTKTLGHIRGEEHAP